MVDRAWAETGTFEWSFPVTVKASWTWREALPQESRVEKPILTPVLSAARPVGAHRPAASSRQRVSNYCLVRLVGSLVGLILVAGCATLPDGEMRAGSRLVVENRTFDEVWTAAVAVLARHLAVPAGDKARALVGVDKKVGQVSTAGGLTLSVSPAVPASPWYSVEVVSDNRAQAPLVRTLAEEIREELQADLASILQ